MQIKPGHRFKSFVILCLLLCLVPSTFANLEVRGVSYSPLKKIASKLNLKLRFQKPHEEALLAGPNIEMRFTKNKRNVLINNISVWLGHPILFHSNDLYVAQTDYSEIITPIINPCSFPTNSNFYHIVLDPGHGGKDEGAHNPQFRLKEKDLTLDVCIRLMQELERMGYKVTLTRPNDQFIALKDRSEFANQKKADLFISIHFNSVECGKNVQGIETFLLPLHKDPSTAENKVSHEDKIHFPGNQYDCWNAMIGYNIQSHLVNDLQSTDRGLKRGRLAVLKNINCPGVLVEVGFLSNNDECEKFRLPFYRQKIAQSIANAIASYHRALKIQPG